jgi:predicted ABC-type ATPase
MNKKLYVISGCNGAGKTTASFTILPEILSCKEFVNADEIAKGLSPFQPEKVSFEAGRIMIKRINELLEANQTFAFETTLATKSYRGKIIKAKKQNYNVTLLFFWLENVDLAIKRVRTRVLEGGHNIDTDVIKRRYINGIKNLFEIYVDIADEVLIFDNSFGAPELIAEKSFDSEMKILSTIKFNNLKKNWNERI